MYLSQLLLDPASRQIRNDLANRYELHRTLCAQFENTEMKEIGLLYRIEQPDIYEVKPITLLVQTEIAPNWNRLFEKGMLVQKAGIKRFELEFQKGDSFYFRVMANPTVRRKEGSFAGKRVELRLKEEHDAWLQRKGKAGGFDIKSLDSKDLGKILSTKNENGKKLTITHQAVQFEGLLDVMERTLFLISLRNGIGSAKAFGFGLISLARRS